MTSELTGYLRNTLDVRGANKSVYEYVVYDSPNVERGFAEELERNEAVKVYAKLPGWFQVPTPLGSYNPDWAILVEMEGPSDSISSLRLRGASSTTIYAKRKLRKLRVARSILRH